MVNKNIVNGSKIRKNPNRDEFYTVRSTAEYLFKYIDKKVFAGKKIHCNCDMPWSEIYKYIKENYSEWKLAGLIATAYNRDGGHGIKTVYDGNNENVTELNGDGDYRSEECLEISKNSDIIVTNPPFSMLDDFQPRFLDMNKDIIIITNMMSLGHKCFRKYLSDDIDLDYMPSQGMSKFKHLDYIISSGGMIKFKYCNYIPIRGDENIFKLPDGEIKNVPCIGLTTFKFNKPFRQPKKTFDELCKAGKINYTDDKGVLEVEHIEDIPVDYDGPIYAPISAALRSKIREKWHIVRFVEEPVIVNGKRRFQRVEIRRKK